MQDVTVSYKIDIFMSNTLSSKLGIYLTWWKDFFSLSFFTYYSIFSFIYLLIDYIKIISLQNNVGIYNREKKKSILFKSMSPVQQDY